MSEKPHQEGAGASPDVSRETRRGEIRSNSERPDGHSSSPEKNKRSSFYVYLAILFGAAFLMLLLAYFVQQRNNDAALDNLRSTTTASRQELLADIQRLEEENLDLAERNQALDAQLSGLREELEQANASYESLAGGYDKYVGYTSILQALYTSEVKLEAGDYAGAASELTDIDFDFFTLTIVNYDAEMEHYNPEGMFLRPRFDALVSALTEQSELDESWKVQE